MAPAAIEQLLCWTPENLKALDALSERLKTSDPSALAKQKRDTCVQVSNIVKGLNAAVLAFGPERIQVIRTQRSDVSEKRHIAVEVAQVKSAVLDGVGTPERQNKEIDVLHELLAHITPLGWAARIAD